MIHPMQRATTSIAKLYCLLFLLSTESLAECQKTLRWNEDPPYSFSVPSNPETIRGIDIDIVQEVLARMGCTMALREMPWARALIELEHGRIDMISGAYRKPEREVYAHFSSIELGTPNVLFVHKQKLKDWDWHSLTGLMTNKFLLGAQIDVSYSNEYEALSRDDSLQSQFVRQSDRSALWGMLEKQRIDGVIADEITAQQELVQMGLDSSIVRTPLVISRAPAFYAFSKKTTSIEFVNRFDKVLNQLVDSGRHQEIVDAYD